MPINSSSIPALRVARAVKRRKRAEGGGITDGLRRVYVGQNGNDDTDANENLPYDPMSGVQVGADLARTEQEPLANRAMRGTIQAIPAIAKGVVWDLPKHAMEHAQQNPLPGLRREDYTDVPPDTSPDERSAFGGIGVKVPRAAWQPVDQMVGDSLEAGMNVMGGTALSAPAGAAGAGPVRRAARAGLDMGEDARLARAAEQGFDTSVPIYHGTSKDADFKKFKDSRHGTWTSADPADASMYAKDNDSKNLRMDWSSGKFEQVNGADRVLPLYAKPLENPYVVAESGYPETLRNTENYKRAQSEWFDQLRRQGHDGVVFPSGVRVDFNNANLRGQFAPFDPANDGRSMILGAGATDRRAAAAAGLDDIDRILEAEKRFAGAPHEPATVGPVGAAAPEAAGDVGGGLAGSVGRGAGLEEAPRTAARWAGERSPVEGLPVKPQYIEGHGYLQPGPIARVHDVAENYMRTVHPDRPYVPPTRYHPIDPEHSKAIAQAYEDMPHTPNDPATKASYEALIDETAKQYQAINATGLKIEPIPAGAPDPYAANPRLAAVDVAENNHLWFFPTEGGFGTVNKITDNPMLRKTGEKIGDHELMANDMFRVVHDYFGHLKQGHGFRAAGEDNAWRTHSAMYSDLARPAMTTETRGQNSWVNYGLHGEKNRSASGADTVYADQKVGLMPEWTMRDRGSPDPTIIYHGSPYSVGKPDPARLSRGEGNQFEGHGLYLSDNEPLGSWYRHQLAARRDPLLEKYGLDSQDGANVGTHLASHGGNVEAAKSDMMAYRDKLLAEADGSKASKNAIARVEGKIAFLSDPERNPGHLYQMAMDAPRDSLIDWDVPLRDQPVLPKVRATIPPEGLAEFDRKVASGATGKFAMPKDRQAMSRMAEAGIPGAEYSYRSRVRGPASRNYVMFDGSMLRLLRKYGVAGIPAAGVMGVDGEERRARGGRVARRLAKKRAEGGSIFGVRGAQFGVMSPGEEADLEEPAPIKIGRALYRGVGDIAKRSFESSESMRHGDGYDPKPVLEAATLPMGTGAIAGAPVRGAETILGAGPVRRIADDTGASMRAARGSRMYAEPEYNQSGSLIFNKGVENPPNPMVQTVSDPHRMMYPGIYRNPKEIAAEAAAQVGPEDPAMKQLFGVTRGDLREMSVGRVGNEAPQLHTSKNPRGALSAQNIQTPQNTQRLQDILGEAGKHEGLRTADAWYIMDPMYKRMVELHGPEAAERYRKLNTMTGMASPGSDVMTEIQRGTGAHWLSEQGRFDDFQRYAGVPEYMRNRIKFPDDMRYMDGHVYHRTSQGDPMAKYLEKGFIDSKAPKVPLYVHASGVPETGFQTAGPVGDAHFSRGVGLTDTRKGPSDVQGSFSTSEYQTLQPWWQHEVAGPSGLESVPAQARLWTALGPQTGVESALGAPKLELFAKQIMETARRLRISPEQARDLVLSGKAGAGLVAGGVMAPAVMDATRERRAGGSVNAAMGVARSIKRAKGGKVHIGPIIGNTDGRADKVPMEVPDGSYVLTADVCSSMGEGNTLSGFEKLKKMFPKSVEDYKAAKAREPSRRASGGRVPILAADGEFVISPRDILDRWGNLDHGHKILDAWQLEQRAEHIKTLKGLAPPARD